MAILAQHSGIVCGRGWHSRCERATRVKALLRCGWAFAIGERRSTPEREHAIQCELRLESGEFQALGYLARNIAATG